MSLRRIPKQFLVLALLAVCLGRSSYGGWAAIRSIDQKHTGEPLSAGDQARIIQLATESTNSIDHEAAAMAFLADPRPAGLTEQAANYLVETRFSNHNPIGHDSAQMAAIVLQVKRGRLILNAKLIWGLRSNRDQYRYDAIFLYERLAEEGLASDALIDDLSDLLAVDPANRSWTLQAIASIAKHRPLPASVINKVAFLFLTKERFESTLWFGPTGSKPRGSFALKILRSPQQRPTVIRWLHDRGIEIWEDKITRQHIRDALRQIPGYAQLKKDAPCADALNEAASNHYRQEMAKEYQR